MLSEIAGNGVATCYAYEPQTLRLSTLRTTRPNQPGRPALLQDLSYTYDPAGNILAVGDAAVPARFHDNQRVEATNTYAYDALYQLLSATGQENANAGPQTHALPGPITLEGDPSLLSNYARRYTYDRSGNLTHIRHQGNTAYTLEMLVSPTSNHAVMQTGSLGVTHVEGHFDACGNLRQLAPGQPLSWDERNQLQRVAQVQRSRFDDDCETYHYDGGGMRIRKTTTCITSGTTRTTQVLYLPGIEIRRTRSNAATVEELHVITLAAAGRQTVRVLHWEVGKPDDIPNDQCRGSLDDQIGSSLMELDRNADILTLEAYYPYGGTAVWSDRNDSETKYKIARYSGKERDATGLYYYGLRYYAPWLSRWINSDPAGTVDGLNLYCMARSNPITHADNMGLGIGSFFSSNDRKINSGSTSPLRNRGLIRGKENIEPKIDFYASRYDARHRMTEAKPFKLEQLKGELIRALGVYDGSQITSAEGAGFIGNYWRKNQLKSNLGLIMVRSGDSGTIGIKIPLSNVKSNEPILVTSGTLSGCTMTYAVDDENFYAMHTGTELVDDDWKTGKQGVTTAYKTHLALTGRPLEGIDLERNDSLVSVFGSYNKAVISYFGKEGTRINESSPLVDIFDYNRVERRGLRAAYSYALLANKKGNVHVETLSEDVSINSATYDIEVLASLRTRLQ